MLLQVASSLAAIEGYIINYTKVEPLAQQVSGIVRVENPYLFRGVVQGLHPGTWYTVCVSAFATKGGKQFSSTCSNQLRVATQESG